MSDDKHWLEPPKWWKKVKPLRWLAVGGIIFVAVSATWTAKVLIGPSEHAETAKFTAQVPDPVPMLKGFKSYDTVDAASKVLAKYKVATESQRPPASGKYPPRDRDTLEVADYKHLGVLGRLTLEFFNNRLYEATFVPADVKGYPEKLRAADPRLKKQPNNRIEFTEGPLRIASNVDFAETDVGKNLKTRPFVIWQDTRLVDLLDEWDRRFVISTSR